MSHKLYNSYDEQSRKTSVYVGKAYDLIQNYYMGRAAERSGLPLINHINEGILYLRNWGITDNNVLDAWCIHPLIQDYQSIPALPCKTLAQEYADIAGKYLCVPENDWIEDQAQLFERLGDMSRDCAMMLLADKIQNQKDFRMYHLFKHERQAELEKYFNLWIQTLLVFYI